MNPPNPSSLLVVLLCAALLCALPACGSEPVPAPGKSAGATPSSGGGGAAARGKRGKGKKKTLEELKAEIQRKSPLTASIFAPVTEKVRLPLVENRNPFFGFVDIRLGELQRQRELEALAKAQASNSGDPVKLEPLQQFDLRQLRPIVTITDTPIAQAEVLDPTGERHSVIIGSLIGPVGNRVVDIRQGEIKIQRKSDDGSGSITCTILRLSLSLDALVQSTLEAQGELDAVDEGGVKCTVISYYPKKLDNIKISYQD